MKKCHALMILIYACIFSLVTATSGQASGVTLQWNPDTDTSVTGYKVYYNADSANPPFSGSGATQGASPINVANLTSSTVSGLDPNHAYYFAVTAYNASGTESPLSSIVSVAETVPPTVSITSPLPNATISGTVTVTASATDNVGVTKVEFYLNGTLMASDASTPYVYSLNAASLVPGTYTIMAKAYDAAGNVGSSGNVSVTVASDTIAPAVSLTAPANNAIVSGTTTITASASDNVGVSKVEFYNNGALLYATNVAPFSYSWNTTSVANGSYTLSAKAYDNTGNVGQSANVVVSVNNSAISAGSIWAATTVPGVVDAGPDSAVELGVRFRSDSAGYITGVRFYKAGTNTGTHIGNLWDNSGKLLASATFTSETTSGWQTVNFATPVAISANTVYVASYHTNAGHYSDDQTYFSGKGVDNAPLHALADGTSGYSGAYTYSSTSSFPSQGWNSSNYWVDVAFTPSSVADITPPTVAISSPTASATVSGTVSVNATASDNVGVAKVEFYVNGVLQATDTVSPYSFSWNTSTLSNGSYTLTAKAYDAANNVSQSSAVSVNVSNPVADTTVPTVAISSPTAGATVTGTVTITATAADNVGVSKVEFYANGVLQGTDTTSPYSFSWNTASVVNGVYNLTAKAYDAGGNNSTSSTVTVTVSNTVATSATSIWPAAAVPSVVDYGPDNAVELGVKFRSDLPGYITGIRFYKASTNTGTHVANLWTSTGTRLATATFSGETASGWQQVNFSKPVAITANTVYVASYHTNVGHFSDDQSFFATKGVDNAPLHALANGVSGPDSVYAYASKSKFPNQSYLSSNYWVDVVFKP